MSWWKKFTSSINLSDEKGLALFVGYANEMYGLRIILFFFDIQFAFNPNKRMDLI